MCVCVCIYIYKYIYIYIYIYIYTLQTESVKNNLSQLFIKSVLAVLNTEDAVCVLQNNTMRQRDQSLYTLLWPDFQVCSVCVCV